MVRYGNPSGSKKCERFQAQSIKLIRTQESYFINYFASVYKNLFLQSLPIH
jgi:hypothetical protein